MSRFVSLTAQCNRSWVLTFKVTGVRDDNSTGCLEEVKRIRHFAVVVVVVVYGRVGDLELHAISD